ARNLLGIKTSDLGRPFQDLDFSFKPVELRSSLQAAYKQRTTVILHDLTWQVDERIVYYEVRIHPLGDYAHNPLGASITWINTSQHKELQNRLEQTNHELETAFEELQSTNEELETTNEELQSTIEELETTNEELHSTNEELETMNEELQSTNEELHATNEELHHRTENLAHLNIIMNSVMSSMQTGLIVVNKDLTIQTWNWRSEDFWGLREDEVVGQNLLGLDIGLLIDQLKKVVLDCLNKDCGSQETTIPARNRRGRDFLCKVGVTPLVKDGKEVLGAVLTLDEALPVEGKNLPS
ncbi:PAS domain-containing protein, partial [bacterium]